MIYTDGTITIKTGSPIVTGTGTQWKKNIHGVAPGQMISIENGTNPVSMMIRAVNSDTELVLSFNAPVARSGAKYSIATTVPDTISDAARTMSANQGYIVYFLQAMQQWMTDTGQVEIELPNGQKVTLDSVKAMNEAIDGKLSIEGGEVGSLSAYNHISLKDPSDVASTFGFYYQDGRAFFSEFKQGKWTGETVIPPGGGTMARTDDFSNMGLQREIGDGIIFRNPVWGLKDFITCRDNGDIGVFSQRVNRWRLHFQQGGIDCTDQLTVGGGLISYSYGDYPALQLRRGNGSYLQIETNPMGSYPVTFANRGADGQNINVIRMPVAADGIILVQGGNAWVDGSGYVRQGSPVIKISPDGNFETNDESEGAHVHRTDTGQYHITGILGYNSDGAWGVNGGISVPKDNNGLELVYVADRVLEDGGIIIETCHRQHAHLPERFQNWRLKEITAAGDRVFYQDGEPCDLPEYTRLDVRVEMPQGSVWNVKQRELAEQMEREQAEREALEAAEQAGEAEE